MAEFFRCAVLEGNKRPTLRYTLAAARVLILAPLSASAQGALEGTIRHAGTGAVVAGARIGIPALNTQSAVPIDAITARDFIEQGDTGLSDLLRTVIPSFNVNPQAVGDAARIVRRASLRGLAPDHTLVLVNGKRRHRASIIMWIGGGFADAAQGPDISAIPAIALRQVEILRDGASAQYGSDAIARGTGCWTARPTARSSRSTIRAPG